MPLEVLYLFPIIVLAYTTQTMIGFGAPLIVITLGANFMLVELLVPILVTLSAIAPGIIAFRYGIKEGCFSGNIMRRLGEHEQPAGLNFCLQLACGLN